MFDGFEPGSATGAVGAWPWAGSRVAAARTAAARRSMSLYIESPGINYLAYLLLLGGPGEALHPAALVESIAGNPLCIIRRH